ncbi:hypothetical protein SAMN04488505_103491 [Chitinophaga rupis]|uniref:Uncharacterized protein n=1 Tax=Chitinophaga rupis TaxID=573321 RepID=A0A1H7VXU5_9BACT|nr:hypothetical protein [Chitinophaga rupis]SEM14152.1 hypothetical protein SAMN04488505_103491 [Chitinophaga rupis]
MKSDSDLTGIQPYPTYHQSKCGLCDDGSYPVPASGDVFLLEAPKINKILLAKSDRENNLNSFVNEFKSFEHGQTILKAHYKERREEKYEVYIDFVQIIFHIRGTQHCKSYKAKLDSYIQQYIPSNTKYLLHLMDDGSKELANYVCDKIAGSFKDDLLPKILDQDQLEEIDPETSGAIVVVGSCVSNGKNLHYISRALRKYEKLRIIYFICLVSIWPQLPIVLQ